MDSSRCIHIPIVPTPTSRTAPGAIFEREINVLIPTHMAEPARGKEPPDLDYHSRPLLSFVGQVSFERAERGVTERARQLVILDQPLDIQVFHSDVGVGSCQCRRDFVLPILALAGHLVVCLCYSHLGFAVVLAAQHLAAERLLKPPQSGLCLCEMLLVLEH